MSGRDEYRVDRRTALATLGTTTVSSLLDAGSGRSRASGSRAALHVRVYPRARSFVLSSGGWDRAAAMAYDGVGDALEQIATHAESNGLESVDWQLEPGSGVDLPSFVNFETLADRFRAVVHERGAVTGETCHLLLWWGPFNYDVGYGGVGDPHYHVAAGDDEGAFAVANVGATERWDSRSVTTNVAIHEMLHTLVAPDVVREVGGGTCDHELGTARQVDENVMEVTPLATAYAGGAGTGTTWPGSGCGDHDEFYRHDGLDGIERWRYTTTLSEGTLEATTLYLRRYLAE